MCVSMFHHTAFHYRSAARPCQHADLQFLPMEMHWFSVCQNVAVFTLNFQEIESS